jgi:hypothetical protein
MGNFSDIPARGRFLTYRDLMINVIKVCGGVR